MIQRPVVCRKFVARETELDYLHSRRLLAAKSAGGIVLVAGEAGIGKSRLLREFAESLAKSRWRIGFGASLEYAQRLYGPILDVLDACDREAAGPLAPAASKREQFDAIAERLSRIASRHAVIGVIEDIHWADTGTLELLAYLASKVERQRVLLVASLRPHEVGSDHPNYVALAKVLRAACHGRIDLAPLDGPSLTEFINETLESHTLPAARRDSVARTSEGNPFFTEELLKAALEREALRTGSEKSAALPSSIRATLLERYRRLESGDRAVLAQAAVIGPAFALALLAQTLDRTAESLLPALLRARDHQLIEEVSPALFRFRHALTRRAIYEGFLGAQAQALHRTIAVTLERRVDEHSTLNELAYHWWAAADGDRSADYNTQAGDAASAVHAHEDAIAFYERALESASIGIRARAQVVEKIADRYLALGQPDRRYATYMHAADLYASAGDEDNQAQCCVRAVISAYTAGRVDTIEQLDALLAKLSPESRIARARAHLGLAWLTASFSRPHDARRHLESVDERALSVIDIAQRYHNVAAWIAMTLGDVPAFLQEFPLWVEASAASKLVGDVTSARLNGAACFASLGLHEEAISQCLQAIALGRTERNVLGEIGAYSNLALAYLQMGNIPAAREALSMLPPVIENSITIANASAAGTTLAVHTGDDTLEQRWFEPAGEALMKFPEADTGSGYAELLVSRGKMAEARMALHQAIPHCERIRGNMRTLITVAKYASTDDCIRARKLLATAADSTSDLPEKPALALFDAYVALRAGDSESGRAHARVAVDGFRRLRYALLEAAALEAAEEFSEAGAVYLRCGAVRDARRLLGAAGERDSFADSAQQITPHGSEGLSPRELEIASLVTRGKSNIEIARLLTISHKTVEKHLGSVYRKLGTSSRVQLAMRLGVTRSAEQS